MITINENNLKIDYISSGKFISNDLWIHPRRIIDSYELIIIDNGILHIQENESAYTLNRNDFIFLHPQKEHFGIKPSPTNTSFYWLHFTINDFSLLNIDSFNGKLKNPYKIINLFKELLHVSYSIEYPEFIRTLISLQVLTELKIDIDSTTKNYRPIVKEICEWIRINSDKMLTVNDVAEYFKYNVDYVSKLFKSTIGLSIKDYITTQKRELAKYYLLNTNYSIKEISYLLGFKESNNFIKYFKYHEKQSPTSYRNTYFNIHLNNK